MKRSSKTLVRILSAFTSVFMLATIFVPGEASRVKAADAWIEWEAEDMTIIGGKGYGKASDGDLAYGQGFDAGEIAASAAGNDYLGALSSAMNDLRIYKRDKNALLLQNSGSPNASYSLTVPEAATYYLWVKVRDNGCDGGGAFFYYNLDSETMSPGDFLAMQDLPSNDVPTQWTWIPLGGRTLSQGTHTLNLLAGAPRLLVDRFLLTQNVHFVPDAPLPEPDTPAAPGSIKIEGEAMSIIGTKGYTKASGGAIRGMTADSVATASGGDYLGLLPANTPPYAPIKSKVAELLAYSNGQPNAKADFTVEPAYAGTHYLWARIRDNGSDGGGGYLYYNFDGEVLTEGMVSGMPYQNAEDLKAEWQWVLLGGKDLQAGGHTLNILIGTARLDLDKLIVTNSALYTPVGPTGDANTNRKTLPDTYAQSGQPTPPNNHPRLLFTASQIPQIKANWNAPENAAALSKFQSYLASSKTGASTVFDSDLLGVLEALAFDYAVNGSQTSGERAVQILNTYLTAYRVQTMTENALRSRDIGAIIFTASEVYDWCYPLLSEDEKKFIVAHCEAMAASLECGYPPTRMGAIVGHGGEAMIQYDLLAFGIATFDECPDIYDFVAGRLYKEFVEPRSYWYDSNTQSQGSAYGIYRSTMDLWGDLLIYQMTGEHMYDENAGTVLYSFLYDRRPDGQMFRVGDDYNEDFLAPGYWLVTREATFAIAALYGGSDLAGLAKSQFLTEAPNLNYFSMSEMTLTPVHLLILNDPEQETIARSTLPLTHYFPSPLGSMTARTGWNFGPNSRDAVAQMRIAEQYAANHQHSDSGSFQLYYRGILTGESGYYDSYFTPEDYNYNKQSVASNTLAIYDPNGRLAAAPGGGNLNNDYPYNGGGQRMPGLSYAGAEPTSIDLVKSPENTMGKVLLQEAGPNTAVPAYSFISGDITSAYNLPSVSSLDRAEQVLRSMVFLPQSDPKAPGLMVIFDKVRSTDPSFQKSFLLHSQTEPEINGNKVIITNENGGQLRMETLLPSNPQMRIIEGFTVGDKTYETIKDPKHASMEAGFGRVEVSPAEENQLDYFLNVLTVGDEGYTPVESVLIGNEEAPYFGARTGENVILFAKDMTAPVQTDLNVPIPGTGSVMVFFAGVKPGTWMVNGQPVSTTDQGLLYFAAAPGEVTLSWENDTVKDLDAAPPLSDEGYSISVGNTMHATPVPPYTAPGGAVMTALSTLSSIHGATIERHGNMAKVIKQTNTLEMTVGSSTVLLNGAEQILADAVSEKDGEIMVPVIAVSQMLGGTCTVNTKAKLITIKAGSLLPPVNAGYANIVSASASVDAAPDQLSSSAWDGDPSTMWWSAPPAQISPEDRVEGDLPWIEFTLDKPYTINAVDVYLNPANVRSAYFKLSYSMDGVNYTTIDQEFRGNLPPPADYEHFELNVPVTAKYLKYIGYGHSGNGVTDPSKFAPFSAANQGNSAVCELRFPIDQTAENYLAIFGYLSGGQIASLKVYDADGREVDAPDVPYGGSLSFDCIPGAGYTFSGVAVTGLAMQETVITPLLTGNHVEIKNITDHILIYPSFAAEVTS